MAPKYMGPTLQDIEYQVAHQHENLSKTVIIINIVLLSLATLAVVLRIWARVMNRVQLLWDDWTMVLSLLLCGALCGTEIWGATVGLGRHAVVLGVPRVRSFLMIEYVYEVIYIAAISAVKIAILLLLRRIFPTPVMKKWIHGLFIFTIIVLLAAFGATIFQCTPISFFWRRVDPSVKGRCNPATPVLVVLASINVITDLIILVLPISAIWRLNLSKKQKISVSGLFLLGVFVCIASAIRLSFLKDVESFSDPTYKATQPAIWSTVEPCIGVVCGNLAILRPLFIKFISNPICSIKSSCQRSLTPKGKRSTLSPSESDVGASPPNKKWGEKQFPGTVTEITAPSAAATRRESKGWKAFLPHSQSRLVMTADTTVNDALESRSEWEHWFRDTPHAQPDLSLRDPKNPLR